jgi:hypothetical protein
MTKSMSNLLIYVFIFKKCSFKNSILMHLPSLNCLLLICLYVLYWQYSPPFVSDGTQWSSFLSPFELHFTAGRFKSSHTWGSHSPLVCLAHISEVWGRKFCYTALEEWSVPQSCECQMILFVIVLGSVGWLYYIKCIRGCRIVVLFNPT